MNIGERVKVSDGVTVYAGDCTYIGDDVNITGKGKLFLGDYVKVHRGTLIVCHSDVFIGHNSWIGERCVIDGTGELRIGNNVGIGIGSSVYTHISFGDTLSGCTLRSSRHITIDDQAWLVGQVCIQACNVAKQSVIMPMSNVQEDITEPNRVWSGNPAARDEAKHPPPWHEPSIEHKRRRFDVLMKNFVKETNVSCVSLCRVDDLNMLGTADLNLLNTHASLFDLTHMTYTKRGTTEELQFMIWLLKHNKAKFIPMTHVESVPVWDRSRVTYDVG